MPKIWPAAAAALIVGIASTLAWFRIEQLRQDPAVPILENNPRATWIRPKQPFNLIANRNMETAATFVRRFNTTEPISDARLTIEAFRHCEVALDRHPIFKSDPDRSWKLTSEIPLPNPLPAGEHLLAITVRNHGGPPCLLVYGNELDLRSDESWACTIDNRQLLEVLPVTATPMPEVATQFPSTGSAFIRVAPLLALVFVGIMFGFHRASKQAAAWQLTPQLLRWLLIAAWIALAANNIWQLPMQFGHDYSAHLEYIQFIATNKSLPLATDGWQMFQSPLFYLLASPIYALLTPILSEDTLVKLLRVLPLLCGCAQIEVVYRTARTVFPRQDDLQRIATLIGGLLPMNVYMSQVIGNEPLAGLLTSIVLLMSFRLLCHPEERRGGFYFAGLGIVWGLALLAKVTPILLAPLLLVICIMHGVQDQRSLLHGFVHAAILTGSTLLVAGWYFGRNWYYLGKPFAGGWDPAAGNRWWQEPGYRTWDQVTTFGVSLDRPVWSSAWSFWDSLYSTLWLDGSTSSLVAPPPGNVWNATWLVVGAWLGLLPTTLIFASLITVWLKSVSTARPALLACWVALVIYLAALLDLYLRLPIYSTAKASYTLGLLPCYALLAAAGSLPVLRYQIPRALLYGALACWAIGVYFTYFAFVWNV